MGHEVRCTPRTAGVPVERSVTVVPDCYRRSQSTTPPFSYRCSGAAAGVEHPEPVDVIGEGPQDGVGIEDAVALSVITHLNPPVDSLEVPELSGVSTLAVVHRSFSWITGTLQARLEMGWCTWAATFDASTSHRDWRTACRYTVARVPRQASPPQTRQRPAAARAHYRDSRDIATPSCCRRGDCCHGCGLYDGP